MLIAGIGYGMAQDCFSDRTSFQESDWPRMVHPASEISGPWRWPPTPSAASFRATTSWRPTGSMSAFRADRKPRAHLRRKTKLFVSAPRCVANIGMGARDNAAPLPKIWR